MGVLIAMTAVLSLFTVYLTPELRLMSFAFLPGAVGSILFGPVAGLIMGFLGDFVAYIVNPHGGYFFGFAVSAMVQNLIYATFLYGRSRLSLLRIALSQALVVALVNLGLNMLWLNIMYGSTAGTLYNNVRLLKSIMEYPVAVGLVYFFGRFAKQLLARQTRK